MKNEKASFNLNDGRWDYPVGDGQWERLRVSEEKEKASKTEPVAVAAVCGKLIDIGRKSPWKKIIVYLGTKWSFKGERFMKDRFGKHEWGNSNIDNSLSDLYFSLSFFLTVFSSLFFLLLKYTHPRRLFNEAQACSAIIM